MNIVLDSSATLAWIYSDEITEAIRQLFDDVADNGAIVPALWRLEVANSLTVAVRRRRIDADFRHAALADLCVLKSQYLAASTGVWRSAFGVRRLAFGVW